MNTSSWLSCLLVVMCVQSLAQAPSIQIDPGNHPDHYIHEVTNLQTLAPPAFYTQLWWFGDNYYSFAPNPEHLYRQNMTAHRVCAMHTPNYGTGGPPPLAKAAPTSPAGSQNNTTPLLGPAEHMRLQHYRNAVPGDTLYLIISYPSAITGIPVQGEIALDIPPPYDQLLTYDDAISDPSFLPNDERKVQTDLKWMLNSTPGGLDRSILVPLKVEQGMDTHIGESIPISVNLVYEGDSTDYHDQVELMVAESHDPNEMQPSIRQDDDCVMDGDEIIYTVRFQNTGDGQTSRVMLVSKLDEHLDLSSISVLDIVTADWVCPGANSNPTGAACVQTSVDHQNRTATWEFNGLVLEGLGSAHCLDAERTKGVFRFKVNVQDAYRIGEDIVCYTDIFFDHHAPVRTNNAITTCPEEHKFPIEKEEPDTATTIFNPWVITIVSIAILLAIILFRARKPTPRGGQ